MGTFDSIICYFQWRTIYVLNSNSLVILVFSEYFAFGCLLHAPFQVPDYATKQGHWSIVQVNNILWCHWQVILLKVFEIMFRQRVFKPKLAITWGGTALVLHWEHCLLPPGNTIEPLLLVWPNFRPCCQSQKHNGLCKQYLTHEHVLIVSDNNLLYSTFDTVYLALKAKYIGHTYTSLKPFTLIRFIK